MTWRCLCRTLCQLFCFDPECNLFLNTQQDSVEWKSWKCEPLVNARTICLANDAFVIAKTVHVGEQSTSAFYLDLSLPERISDFVLP